jgi:hypothetical protein
MQEVNEIIKVIEFKITSDIIEDCLEESLEKIVISKPNTN